MRLKFRDKNNNNELRDSSSIKINFLSNLFPKFISIGMLDPESGLLLTKLGNAIIV